MHPFKVLGYFKTVSDLFDFCSVRPAVLSSLISHENPTTQRQLGSQALWAAKNLLNKEAAVVACYIIHAIHGTGFADVWASHNCDCRE